jgi:phytoene dehydrogenase-like protein
MATREGFYIEGAEPDSLAESGHAGLRSAMKKDMIIVGAGIAGLATGCYAQLNDYQSSIFEMHSTPGGLCAAWTRKGYTFDLSMHELVGSESGPFHKLWQELGVTENREFYYHDEMFRVEGLTNSLSVCPDPARLLDQLIALSPEDAERSRELVRLVTGPDMMGAVSLKPSELLGISDRLKTLVAVLPHIRTLVRYGKKTFQEFAEGFQDDFLRDAIRFIADAPNWSMPRFPMSAMAGWMSSMLAGSGTASGGSHDVLLRIAEKYQRLGGEIAYGNRVVDVIVENDRAVGIRLDDGSEHRADTIVWAGDGHTVVFDILGGRYLDDTIRAMYERWIPIQPLVNVSLGVARDLSDQPRYLIFEPPEPILIAGEERRWLTLRHRCFDPSMAPAGKSTAEVWYPTSYEYWEGLARDRDRYEEEKRRIANATITALDDRWPGFAADIEVVDVATPATYVRYTGNWKGSPGGWSVTPDNLQAGDSPARSLTGLSNFWMVGQWTAPSTGTIMAALSGRQLIQLLCKGDKRAFVTSA